MANQNELLGAAFCKGKLSLGSPPQPQLASAQEINTSCFRPGPSALHRVKLSWDAPGSLGPAALLGVSSARNPLPTGSPSLGSRIGRAKVLCAQAPSMPPEPARPLSAEAPSQRRRMTSFWALHSAKGNSPPAAIHSLTVPWRRKSTQAVCAPGHPLSIGQSGAGPPLAPWALLLYWGSLAPKSHSPRILLRGECRIGCAKGFCAQAPAITLRQLGRSVLRTRGSYGPKRASGSCSLQRETLLGQQTTPPTRLGSRKQCKPFSPQALRSP